MIFFKKSFPGGSFFFIQIIFYIENKNLINTAIFSSIAPMKQ